MVSPSVHRSEATWCHLSTRLRHHCNLAAVAVFSSGVSAETFCEWMCMGVSENSVPLNPMVLLIIIPIKWLFHWEYTLFSDKPVSENRGNLGSDTSWSYILEYGNVWTKKTCPNLIKADTSFKRFHFVISNRLRLAVFFWSKSAGKPGN